MADEPGQFENFCRSYADTNDFFGDGKQDKYEIRTLDFRHDGWLSRRDVVEAFDRALEYGRYNGFTVNGLERKLDRLVEDPDSVKFQPGREGSPVIYIRPARPEDGAEDFKRIVRDGLGADEKSLIKFDQDNPEHPPPTTEHDIEGADQAGEDASFEDKDLSKWELRLWWD